jgi:hypothetical protein
LKSALAITGLVILIVGIGLIAYGLSNPLKQTTPHTSTIDITITPKTTRNIDAGGTWSPGAVVLNKSDVVSGIFTISNYSQSDGPVFLYIQNQSQFIAWGACAPCNSPSLENWTLPSSGTYSFTWTVPYNGSFYMTFDDESYGSVAQASYAANATIITTNLVVTLNRNTVYLYSGAGLIAVGAIIVAAGIIVGTPTRKQETVNPKFNPEDKPGASKP